MAKAASTKAALTIASKNYGSWSLRGWLLCKLAGLDFEEQTVASDDPSTRAELLLLSPSFLVPCLTHRRHQGLGYAGDRANISTRPCPRPACCRREKAARAHCRSICGEMHSGFTNLRSALPMNLKAHHPGFKIWAGAQADIDRVAEHLARMPDEHQGPFLFGTQARHGRRHVRAGGDPLHHL